MSHQSPTPSFAITSAESETLTALNNDDMRMKAGYGYAYAYGHGGNRGKEPITTPERAIEIAKEYKAVKNDKYREWEKLAEYMDQKRRK